MVANTNNNLFFNSGDFDEVLSMKPYKNGFFNNSLDLIRPVKTAAERQAAIRELCLKYIFYQSKLKKTIGEYNNAYTPLQSQEGKAKLILKEPMLKFPYIYSNDPKITSWLKKTRNNRHFVDRLGITTWENPLFYVQPLNFNKDKKKLNHLLAGDFETVLIPKEFLSKTKSIGITKNTTDIINDVEKYDKSLKKILSDQPSVLEIKDNISQIKDLEAKKLTSPSSSDLRKQLQEELFQFINNARKKTPSAEQAAVEQKDSVVNGVENIGASEDVVENDAIVEHDAIVENDLITDDFEHDLVDFSPFDNTLMVQTPIVASVVGNINGKSIKKIFNVSKQRLQKGYEATADSSFKMMSNYVFFLIKQVFADCISRNENLIDSTEQYVVYFHNMARFDGYFLLNTILNSDLIVNYLKLNQNADKLSFQPTILNGKIVELKLGCLTFKDSFLMAPLSLNRLSQELLQQSKNNFSVDNPTFDNLKKIVINKKLYKVFKNYCLKDSSLLFLCVSSMQKTFFESLKLDISNYISTPSLGMALWRTFYYKFTPQLFINSRTTTMNYEIRNDVVSLKNSHEALFTNKTHLEPLIRESFYGGRVGVFKPHGLNVIGLDINSLYPFSCSAPLPFGIPKHVKIPPNTVFDFNKNYGFVKIEWVSPLDSKILPVLPVRLNGVTIYPRGAHEGWYYIKEAELAAKMGYKIRVLEAIIFKKKAGFKKFVFDLYNLRSKYKKGHPLNLLIKLVLNSTSYGKFAIKLNKPHTKMVKADNMKRLHSIVFNKEIKNVVHYPASNINLITIATEPTDQYYNFLKSKNTFIGESQQFKKPFFKNLKEKTVKYKHSFVDSKKANACLHLSSAVTSQARITMYYFMAYLYYHNFLNYSDTDSLYGTFKLSDLGKKINRVHDTKLGFFKIEKQASEAVFVGQKLYAFTELKNNDQQTTVKFRGYPVNNNQLEKQALFDSMKKSIDTATVFSTEKKDLKRLKRDTALFSIENTNFNSVQYSNTTFNKFQKKVLRNNKWVNTKPLIIDTFGNEISLYAHKKIFKYFKGENTSIRVDSPTRIKAVEQLFKKN